ncbi:regulatory protein GemA [Shumkonia mesophila]|uniref:regulatory protein GemA n=1 Tax=Shumkonia mesophila TaxID=2838854 RepID=UPI002934DF3C|nr:regulatory protein GemA [Shumkonia mesophila]
MPATARKIDPFRRSLYGKIEIAKKALGLDDETYRDILEARYGKRSRTGLRNPQLVDLVEHFKTLGFKPIRKAPARAGGRPMADGDTQRKIRALWISLYHLGAVSDVSERALVAFVKRVTGGRAEGIDALQWLDGKAAFKAIEALKAMAVRAGVDWSPYKVRTDGLIVDGWDPRSRVMEAQWRRLAALGAVRIADPGALSNWLSRFFRTGPISAANLSDDEKDRAIEALGAMVRRAKADAEVAP